MVPTLAIVASALDASFFSNDPHLAIWTPDLQDGNLTLGAEGGVRPSGVVITSARFNRLVWGYVSPDRPEGVLAAGLESSPPLHLRLSSQQPNVVTSPAGTMRQMSQSRNVARPHQLVLPLLLLPRHSQTRPGPRRPIRLG
ncbi:protein transport protein S31 [Ceratobasidium sp. UAMH 11750]|nr:protein transport protein S31 [Ceratobasidium sp. UAMH 11750]